jgi:hypothetical protein
MRILFDHGTPSAEEAGFEMLLTTDKNIRYQQNLSGARLQF